MVHQPLSLVPRYLFAESEVANLIGIECERIVVYVHTALFPPGDGHGRIEPRDWNNQPTKTTGVLRGLEFEVVRVSQLPLRYKNIRNRRQAVRFGTGVLNAHG